MEKRERQPNIELLRIIAMMGVIVLHYNNPEIGGGLRFASGANKGILIILESIFICGVNLYMLISGYFLCSSNNRKLEKPAELLVQVILFHVGFYILGILMGNYTFSVIGLLESMVPNNYFVILYIVCFLISPYVNVVFHNIGKKQSLRLLVLLGGVFSIWPTIVDVLKELTLKEWDGLSSIGISGSQNGYTIVNFVLMYCIGAYLRMYMEKDFRFSALLAVWTVVVALLCGWTVLNSMHGIVGGSAWAYCNPLVIAEAIILFLLFKKIQIKDHGVINTLAKGSFTVYLLHTAFLGYIKIPEAVQASPGFLLLHIFLAAVVIYLICFLCYIIYEKITRPVFRWLETKWSFALKVE